MIRAFLALFRRRPEPTTSWYEPLNEPKDFWVNDITAPSPDELPEHWADDLP